MERRIDNVWLQPENIQDVNDLQYGDVLHLQIGTMFTAYHFVRVGIEPVQKRALKIGNDKEPEIYDTIKRKIKIN